MTRALTLCSARCNHEVAGGCSGGDHVAGKARVAFSLQTSLGRSESNERTLKREALPRTKREVLRCYPLETAIAFSESSRGQSSALEERIGRLCLSPSWWPSIHSMTDFGR